MFTRTIHRAVVLPDPQCIRSFRRSLTRRFFLSLDCSVDSPFNRALAGPFGRLPSRADTYTDTLSQTVIYMSWTYMHTHAHDTFKRTHRHFHASTSSTQMSHTYMHMNTHTHAHTHACSRILCQTSYSFQRLVASPVRSHGIIHIFVHTHIHAYIHTYM